MICYVLYFLLLPRNVCIFPFTISLFRFSFSICNSCRLRIYYSSSLFKIGRPFLFHWKRICTISDKIANLNLNVRKKKLPRIQTTSKRGWKSYYAFIFCNERKKKKLNSSPLLYRPSIRQAQIVRSINPKLQTLINSME